MKLPIRFSLSSLLLLVLGVALIMYLNFDPQKLSFAEGGQYGYPIPFYRTFRMKEKIPLSQLTQDQLDELRDVLGSDYDLTMRAASYAGLSTDNLTLAMDRDRFLGLRFVCDLVGWLFFLLILLLMHSIMVFYLAPDPRHPKSSD